jgi:hypothetical protein
MDALAALRGPLFPHRNSRVPRPLTGYVQLGNYIVPLLSAGVQRPLNPPGALSYPTTQLIMQATETYIKTSQGGLVDGRLCISSQAKQFNSGFD